MKRAIVVLICIFAVLFVFNSQLIGQETPKKNLSLVLEETYPHLESNLTEDSLGYFYIADERTEAGICRVHIVVNEKEQILSIAVFSPIFISEEKKDILSKFITTANNYVYIGYLGINLNDQLYFKIITNLEGGKLTKEMVEHTIGTNLVTAEALFKFINLLVYNDMTYTEAVEKFVNMLLKEHNARNKK